MKKKIAVFALALVLCTGCASINTAESKAETTQATGASAESAAASDNETEPASGTQPEDADDAAAEAVEVKLDGSSVTIPDGAAGITADGSKITVTAPGRYYFTGKLDDGQIIVNATKEDKVDIYLDGVEITSSSSAPIRVESADGCTVHLTEGSTNVLTDGTANEFSACISAKDDLTIKGKGKLVVVGSTKHAIKTSNDLRIKNGEYELSAKGAGLYGEDSVQLTGGNILITACKDGIKSVIDVGGDAAKGIVTAENTTVDVQNAQGNGIEATSGVTVTSGSIKIHSLKQAVNCKIQNITEGTVVKY